MLELFLVSLLSAQTAPPSPPSPPPAVDGLHGWFSEGSWVGDFRLRYEHVDAAAFVEDANALTLRSRLGFRTASWSGFSALVEAEAIVALLDDYNSTRNGRANFPAVVDPEGKEINQAYLSYGWNTPTQVVLGRQRINYDNQRFFGSVGFRQNEQTFDAASLQLIRNGFTLRAAYLDEVHRIFGNDNPNPVLRQQDLDASIFNLSYQLPSAAGRFFQGNTLTTYGYFIGNEDLPLSSARTLGLRYVGGFPVAQVHRFNYTLEYAQQDDYRDGSALIDSNYHLIEAGVALDGGRFSFKVGQERLSGNGVSAFQTPFATLHAFNGWSDRFLVTPNFGLRDLFMDASAKIGPGLLSANWHRYDADQGELRLGRELGLQYFYPVRPKLGLTFKISDYQANSFSSDARVVWLFLDYKL